MSAAGLVQGAESGSGMSMIGLRRARIASPAGGGTIVAAELPCEP